MLVLSSYGETYVEPEKDVIKLYFKILQREFELKYGLKKGKIEVEIAKLESALRSRVTKGQVPSSGPELDKEIQKIQNTANFLINKLKQEQAIDVKALQEKMSNPIPESELNAVLTRWGIKPKAERSGVSISRPVRQKPQIKSGENIVIKAIEQKQYVAPTKIIEQKQYVAPTKIIEQERYVAPVETVSQQVEYKRPIVRLRKLRKSINATNGLSGFGDYLCQILNNKPYLKSYYRR